MKLKKLKNKEQDIILFLTVGILTLLVLTFTTYYDSIHENIANKNTCEYLGEEFKINHLKKTENGYLACCKKIYENHIEINETCIAVKNK